MEPDDDDSIYTCKRTAQSPCGYNENTMGKSNSADTPKITARNDQLKDKSAFSSEATYSKSDVEINDSKENTVANREFDEYTLDKEPLKNIPVAADAASSVEPNSNYAMVITDIQGGAVENTDTKSERESESTSTTYNLDAIIVCHDTELDTKCCDTITQAATNADNAFMVTVHKDACLGKHRTSEKEDIRKTTPDVADVGNTVKAEDPNDEVSYERGTDTSTCSDIKFTDVPHTTVLEESTLIPDVPIDELGKEDESMEYLRKHDNTKSPIERKEDMNHTVNEIMSLNSGKEKEESSATNSIRERPNMFSNTLGPAVYIKRESKASSPLNAIHQNTDVAFYSICDNEQREESQFKDEIHQARHHETYSKQRTSVQHGRTSSLECTDTDITERLHTEPCRGSSGIFQTHYRNRSRSPLRKTHTEEAGRTPAREPDQRANADFRRYVLEQPDYILQQLGSNTKRLSKYFELAVKDIQLNNVLMQVINKCFSCEEDSMLELHVINTIKDNGYIEKSINAMQDILLEDEREAVNLLEPLTNLLNISIRICEKTPSYLVFILGTYCLIKSFIERIENISNIDITIAKEAFNTFETKKDHCKQRKVQSNSNAELKTSQSVPPDNYREISIFPQISDLSTELPYLRVNKVKGCYDSINHYLDVQFRLLREDFIGPLREGITKYVGQAYLRGKKKVDNLRIYEHVRIATPVCRNGVNHVVLFDTSKFRRMTSDRLKYGSLLCFSKDNFASCYCATVVDNDRKQDGQVTVKFAASASVIKPLIGSVFTMAETVAYFEAFRHVLSSLQNIREGDLAFDRYIIECKQDVLPPRYLRENPDMCFDLRPLHDDDAILYDQRQFEAPGTIRLPQETEFSDESEQLEDVRMMSDDWPDKDMLNLDESQMLAVKTALTKEFSVIQGPPGCGKTYIGLKIVKALLHNKDVWSEGELSAPILVVCYTNHALDQFMEGIHDFYKGDILRVGGRSKSAVLNSCTLSSVRRSFQRVFDFQLIKRNKGKTRGQMNSTRIKINTDANCIDICKNNIIKEDALFEEMTPLCLNQFAYFKKHALRRQKPIWAQFLGTTAIVEWLGIDEEAHTIHLGAQRTGGGFISDEYQDMDTYFPDLARERLFDWSEQTDENYLDENRILHFKNGVVAFDLEKATEKPVRISLKEWKLTSREIHELVAVLKSNIRSNDIMSEEEASQVIDIFDEQFTKEQRWRLYRYWINKKCQKLNERIDESVAHFEELYNDIDTLEMEINKKIMEKASVIGMTTTCGAKFQSILQEIKPPVMVVEEAAEVFESHLVSNLTSGCQQLILIGDHKQLKPKPNMYTLETKYNMAISLFERMVRNGIRCDCLDIQHRMRPEIADLIRYMYDNLKDHESVMKYSHIKGIAQNMYFVNHSVEELYDEGLKSYSNSHEADFLVALCQYILQQGYSPTRITLLTTYKGQMFTLKKKMMAEAIDKQVKVTVVDNYQGEENDIILLSLVRSKLNGKIGFIGTDNRVCVALSRAKKGLFVIGNFDMFAKESCIWKQIVKQQKERGNISEALPLKCQNHPNDNAILVKHASDFENAPKGGCKKTCDVRLDCGHVCDQVCHIEDRNHTRPCTKPCVKRCESGHMSCKQLCYERCLCIEIVEQTIQKCGHTVELPCFKDVDMCQCQVECTVELKCGHTGLTKCSEIETYECKVECKKELPCGHCITLPCSESRLSRTYTCSETCTLKLNCGHTAEVKCYKTATYKCMIQCKKTLSCGHNATIACSQIDAYICKQPCRKILACGHRCRKECYRECEPCQESVTRLLSDCGHRMQVKCSVDVNRSMCKKPCDQTLPCGHKCVSSCGDQTYGETNVYQHDVLPYDTISVTCALGHTNICKTKCNSVLACGHVCKGYCSLCVQGKFHIACDEPCNCNLVCGHKCTGICSACNVCQRLGQPHCYHGHYLKRCNAIYTPCNKPCMWICPHFKCQKLCSELCDRPRCDKACPKFLLCGHKCIGICGEPCPTLCKRCNRGLLVRFLHRQDDIHEGTFVELDCGHLIRYDVMDEYMDTVGKRPYIKRCPVCSKPIYRSNRYGNIVKTTLAFIAKSKKSIMRHPLNVTQDFCFLNAIRGKTNEENTKAIQNCISKLISKEQCAKLMDTVQWYMRTQTKQWMKDIERLINCGLDQYSLQMVSNDTTAKLEELKTHGSSTVQMVSEIEKEYDHLQTQLNNCGMFSKERQNLIRKLIASFNKWFGSCIQWNTIKLSLSSKICTSKISTELRNSCQRAQHTSDTCTDASQNDKAEAVLDTKSLCLHGAKIQLPATNILATGSSQMLETYTSNGSFLQTSETKTLPADTTISEQMPSVSSSNPSMVQTPSEINKHSSCSGSTSEAFACSEYKCTTEESSSQIIGMIHSGQYPLESQTMAENTSGNQVHPKAESPKLLEVKGHAMPVEESSQWTQFNYENKIDDTVIIREVLLDIVQEVDTRSQHGYSSDAVNECCKMLSTETEQSSSPCSINNIVTDIDTITQATDANEHNDCDNTLLTPNILVNANLTQPIKTHGMPEDCFMKKIEKWKTEDATFMEHIKAEHTTFIGKVRAGEKSENRFSDIFKACKSNDDFSIRKVHSGETNGDSFMSKLKSCPDETHLFLEKIKHWGCSNDYKIIFGPKNAEPADGEANGDKPKTASNSTEEESRMILVPEQIVSAEPESIPDNIVHIKLMLFTGRPYFHCPVSKFTVKSQRSTDKTRTGTPSVQSPDRRPAKDVLAEQYSSAKEFDNIQTEASDSQTKRQVFLTGKKRSHARAVMPSKAEGQVNKREKPSNSIWGRGKLDWKNTSPCPKSRPTTRDTPSAEWDNPFIDDDQPFSTHEELTMVRDSERYHAGKTKRDSAKPINMFENSNNRKFTSSSNVEYDATLNHDSLSRSDKIPYSTLQKHGNDRRTKKVMTATETFSELRQVKFKDNQGSLRGDITQGMDRDITITRKRTLTESCGEYKQNKVIANEPCWGSPAIYEKSKQTRPTQAQHSTITNLEEHNQKRFDETSKSHHGSVKDYNKQRPKSDQTSTMTYSEAQNQHRDDCYEKTCFGDGRDRKRRRVDPHDNERRAHRGESKKTHWDTYGDSHESTAKGSSTRYHSDERKDYRSHDSTERRHDPQWDTKDYRRESRKHSSELYNTERERERGGDRDNRVLRDERRRGWDMQNGRKSSRDRHSRHGHRRR